jgi:hypothetical protein
VNDTAIALFLSGYASRFSNLAPTLNITNSSLDKSVYYLPHKAITAFYYSNTVSSQHSSEVGGGSGFLVAYPLGKIEGNIYQQGSIKFSLIQRLRIS